jgi:ribosomal protein L11
MQHGSHQNHVQKVGVNIKEVVSKMSRRTGKEQQGRDPSLTLKIRCLDSLKRVFLGSAPSSSALSERAVKGTARSATNCRVTVYGEVRCGEPSSSSSSRADYWAYFAMTT